MFDNQKFITKGVAEKIPVELQIFMWEQIRSLPVDKDYLQVFSFSNENGKQKVIHSQEEPEYRKDYVFKLKSPITGKVFVIDDITHSTMLMSQEY